MNDELYYFMDAHNDDDAPDGAWWQMLEDAASSWITENGANLNEHDMVHEYISRKSDEQAKES